MVEESIRRKWVKAMTTSWHKAAGNKDLDTGIGNVIIGAKGSDNQMNVMWEFRTGSR